MASGWFDANGIWHYGADDPASPTPDLLNMLGDSVTDWIDTDKTVRGAAVVGSSTTSQTGVLSTPMVYTTASVSLPAGTWLLTGMMSATNNSTTDTLALELYNDTAAAAVSASRGPAGLTSTTISACLLTQTVVLVLASTTVFKVRLVPNGGSTPKATSLAGAPAACLNAVRLL